MIESAEEYRKRVYGARWAGVSPKTRQKIMKQRAKARWADKEPYKVCECGAVCRTRQEYHQHRRKANCRKKKVDRA